MPPPIACFVDPTTAPRHVPVKSTRHSPFKTRVAAPLAPNKPRRLIAERNCCMPEKSSLGNHFFCVLHSRVKKRTQKERDKCSIHSNQLSFACASDNAVFSVILEHEGIDIFCCFLSTSKIFQHLQLIVNQSIKETIFYIFKFQRNMFLFVSRPRRTGKLNKNMFRR